MNPMLQLKRNECLNLVRMGNRKINEIRFNDSESPEHWMKKEEICRQLSKEGKEFVTEAIFNNGFRCDVLCLDTFEVFEVICTETEASIIHKLNNYPKGLRINEVRI